MDFYFFLLTSFPFLIEKHLRMKLKSGKDFGYTCLCLIRPT